MKLFHAVNFMILHMEGHAYDNLLKLPDPDWLARLLSTRQRKLARSTDAIKAGERESYDAGLAAFENECIDLELKTCADSLRRMRRILANPNGTYEQIWEIGKELDGRLRAEMEGRVFLSLSMEEAKYFENYRQRWGEFLELYPSTEDDIEEASKCIALSRNTACVFHLMRVLEVALRGMSLCLNIPLSSKNAERNWGVILKTIKENMEARSKGGSGGWNEPSDKAFFEAAYAYPSGVNRLVGLV